MLTEGQRAWDDNRLKLLSAGWLPERSGAAAALVSSLARQLGCSPTSVKAERDVLTFALDLSRIRLKGTDAVPCALVAGQHPDTLARVRWIVRTHTRPGRVFIVFALSDELIDGLKTTLLEDRCVLVTRTGVVALLESANALAVLKDAIVRAVPRLSLIPYDVLCSASGGMFFGRSVELNRLRSEDTTSFALAGPGRAGKTSLAKHYVQSLRAEGGSRGMAVTFIDLMECDRPNLTGYLHFLAQRIGLKREPAGATDFLYLLRALTFHLQQPLNLVLDEADDLCMDENTSNVLATAARNGLIRLTLCGRGDLFRTMIDPISHFTNRLKLLRIGPLDDHAARRLLVEPLADLDLPFVDRQAETYVLRLTGRFPHLIQLYAKRLAECAIELGRDCIDAEHLEALACDHEIAQYAVSPLQDLRDPLARYVALALLKDERDVWSLRDVMALTPSLSVDRANDLCNELVISNILIWHGGAFRLANEATRTYAKGLGYLDVAYEEARGAIATSPAPFTR